MSATYEVIRIDDHGNEALIATGCTETEAKDIMWRMERRGHKQTYVTRRLQREDAK